jgi:Fe-S cluster biogenesis protein NfuA/nitrite reductase/ring-hydroxylating ferredoxin subunit
LDDEAARERVTRVEALLEEVEALGDPAAGMATELVGAMLDLYGEGLGRIVSGLADAGHGGLPPAVAEDELVSHLLFLHDLHPVDLDTRVREALGEVRPYLESHGGNVELLSTEGGVVRLRLEGSCSGCPSSAMTLKLAIEDAIYKIAPEVEAIEAEGATEAEPQPQLLQLEMSGPVAGNGTAAGAGAIPASGNGAEPADGGDPWTMAGGLAELSGGRLAVKQVGGESVLFLRLDQTPYAYRPSCPACEASLAEASLRGAELTCAGCGKRYDVQRAGRCIDAPDRYLEPIPLLTTDAGLVKVAVGARAA